MFSYEFYIEHDVFDLFSSIKAASEHEINAKGWPIQTKIWIPVISWNSKIAISRSQKHLQTSIRAQIKGFEL